MKLEAVCGDGAQRAAFVVVCVLSIVVVFVASQKNPDLVRRTRRKITCRKRKEKGEDR